MHIVEQEKESSTDENDFLNDESFDDVDDN